MGIPIHMLFTSISIIFRPNVERLIVRNFEYQKNETRVIRILLFQYLFKILTFEF